VLGAFPAVATAVVMPGVGRPLQVVQRPVRLPEAGEAVIQIDACGVCGSDIFLHAGGFGPDKLPVVPGHEASGHVVAVSSESDRGWLGTQVALYYINAPREAIWTQSGHENVGPDVRRMGVDDDGAFAEYVTRPLHTLVAVDPELDPADVAVATDALATPYHALIALARVRPGETVAVIGLGGVGSNAVQIAKHAGATVIAIGRDEAKMLLATTLGADVVARADAGAATIRRMAGEQIDVVVQCAGSADMDRLAIDIAGYRTRIVLVGAVNEPFPIASTELIWRELAVLGSRGFTRQDIEEVLTLVRDGRLRTSHLVNHRRPLEEAGAALDDLRVGRVMRTLLTTKAIGAQYR